MNFTEMECDIYERAFIHSKKKNEISFVNITNSALFYDGKNEIKEYWDDYFSGKPLYF